MARHERSMGKAGSDKADRPRRASRRPRDRQEGGGGNPQPHRLRIGAIHEPEEAAAERTANALSDGSRDRPSGAPPPALASSDMSSSGVSQPGARLFGATPGQPLDAAIRAQFEPAIGRNLEDVRIHRGDPVDEKAEMLGAAAFALGSHVELASDAPQVGCPAGDRLLAHELAHVADGEGDVIRRQPVMEIGATGDRSRHHQPQLEL